MLRVALRAFAVLIAVAAAIDPAWSTLRPSLTSATVVAMTQRDATAVLQRVRTALPDVSLDHRSVVHGRIPCAAGVPCILVADGTIGGAVATDTAAPLSLIDMSAEDAPDVRIASVGAAASHASAAGAMSVSLVRRNGSTVTHTRVRVLDGGVVVGSADAAWAAEDALTVSVPWWPVKAGARLLHVDAGSADHASSAVDVGLSIASGKTPVLVLDARPSWNSTFIRRVLEDDPRFTVEHRTRVAPALTAGTPRAQLDAHTLERTSLLIVGGLDALTGADVDLIDRYARVRGGSVLLLPEQAPRGAVQPLFLGSWLEQLSTTPVSVGPLKAAEVLHASNVPETATVVASAGSVPAIVTTPIGRGRITIAGAMDAWRYRDTNSKEFDAFWSSLAQTLGEGGQALTVRLAASMAAPSTRVPLVVTRRSFEEAPSAPASAVLRCDDGPSTVVRLWPAGAPGEFFGEAPMAGGASCVVDASVGEASASAAIAVAAEPRRAPGPVLAELRQAVEASGGMLVAAGQESLLARAIRPNVSPTVTTVYPMRSWWWLLPFAGALSAEWWLRRRAGLR